MDTFKTRRHLQVGSDTFDYFSLPELAKKFPAVETLPYSIKILLENLLRREDNAFVKKHDIEILAGGKPGEHEIGDLYRATCRGYQGCLAAYPEFAQMASMLQPLVESEDDFWRDELQLPLYEAYKMMRPYVTDDYELFR